MRPPMTWLVGTPKTGLTGSSAPLNSFQVVQDIDLEAGKVLVELGPLAVLFEQGVEEPGDGILADLPVHLLDLLGQLPLDVAGGLEVGLELLAELGLLFVQRLPLLFLEGEVLGLLHGAVFDQGDERRAGGGHLKLEALAAGLGGDLIEKPLLLRLPLLDDPLALVFVFVGGKGLAELPPDDIKQLVKLVLERLAMALRQVDDDGAVRLFEVVEIAPVLKPGASPRACPFLDYFFDVGLDHGCLAGAGDAGDEDVVAGATDVQAEIHGGDGPLLADELAERGQVRRAFEVENLRVALPAELIDRQFKILEVHRRLLFINPKHEIRNSKLNPKI